MKMGKEKSRSQIGTKNPGAKSQISSTHDIIDKALQECAKTTAVRRGEGKSRVKKKKKEKNNP